MVDYAQLGDANLLQLDSLNGLNFSSRGEMQCLEPDCVREDFRREKPFLAMFRL